MATPKGKRKLDRKLAKALTDLNKIFSQEELAKKFKLKKHQIRYYKQYRKRKPLSPKKREAIIKFWQKLKKQKKKETQKYHYRVVRGRIKPSPFPAYRQIDELYRVFKTPEVLAKKLKISPSTAKRWQKKEFIRLRKESRKKIYELYKEITKKWAGLFFIGRSVRRRYRGRWYEKTYSYIKYFKNYYGRKEDFLLSVYEAELGIEWRARVDLRIIDELVAEEKKFKVGESKEFFKHLKEVDRAYFNSSLRECRQFVVDNFVGRKQTELLRELRKYER